MSSSCSLVDILPSLNHNSDLFDNDFSTDVRVNSLLPYPDIRLRPSVGLWAGKRRKDTNKRDSLDSQKSLPLQISKRHPFSFFNLLIGVQVTPIQTAHPTRIQRLSPILLLPRAVHIPFSTPLLHDLSRKIAPSTLNPRPPTRRISDDSQHTSSTWVIDRGRT